MAFWTKSFWNDVGKWLGKKLSIGDADAGNFIDLFIIDVVNIASTAVASASAQEGCVNIVDLQHCVFEGPFNILQDCRLKYDINIMEQTDISQDVQNKLTVITNQTAKEIFDQWGINISSSTATNIYKGLINLRTDIVNNVLSNCKQRLLAINSITCDGADVGVFYASQKAVIDALISCTQDATIYSSVKQSLVFQISQEADATIVNNVGRIIIALMVLAAVSIAGPGVGGIMSTLPHGTGALQLFIFLIIPILAILADCYTLKLLCTKSSKSKMISLIRVGVMVIIVLCVGLFVGKL